MNRTLSWFLGASLIIGIMAAVMIWVIPSYTVYFYTPSEAVEEKSDLSLRDIKIGGMVQDKSIVWQPMELRLTFALTDLAGAVIQVSYHGTPPDMFKENAGAVVEGRLSKDRQSFVAKNLLVKHSEEYKAPDEKISMDKHLLERSLFKDQRQ